MSAGGRREGAGRKPGGLNKMSAAAREIAARTGELPHEVLLRVSRGETIDGYKPSFAERMDAAKAAAPYYAPKLAATTLEATFRPTVAAEDLSDDELAAIVAGHTEFK